MCAVSMIGDEWRRNRLPDFPWIYPPTANPPMPSVTKRKIKVAKDTLPKAPSQEEFERLKAEVEKLKEDLRKAKEEDIKNNEPDCDMDDKTEVLERIGRIVGVALEEFFSGSKTSRRK